MGRPPSLSPLFSYISIAAALFISPAIFSTSFQIVSNYPFLTFLWFSPFFFSISFLLFYFFRSYWAFSSTSRVTFCFVYSFFFLLIASAYFLFYQLVILTYRSRRALDYFLLY